MRGRRQRAIDRALCGIASPRDVDLVVGALRGDAALRRDYDRAVSAMRVLEHTQLASTQSATRVLASTEIDWVERMLEADGTLGATARAAAPKWWFIAASVGAAAAGVLLLTPRSPMPPEADDLVARGGPRAEGLALSALCDRDAGRSGVPALTEVAEGRCAVDATLGFAVRVDGRHRGGDHLVLFGIGAGGDVQYYLPTPDQPSVAIVTRDAWTPLQRAVRLAVNHAPGGLRVYAALVERPPTVDDVDAAAEFLRTAADDEQTPWIERLGSAHPWTAQCPDGRCSSAQLDLWLDPGSPVPESPTPESPTPGSPTPRSP